ncbi:hypothetical protein J1605_022500 [Eschrichtius robustus]|uniref:Uncharacterized protein n=1 Tax=Eschrichtius robustus TaxID=9764 RepID=A0AB34HAJ6_ESCRO|nr:hypothetical protein J1605_022500 [Eschrichtius robustus]
MLPVTAVVNVSPEGFRPQGLGQTVSPGRPCPLGPCPLWSSRLGGPWRPVGGHGCSSTSHSAQDGSTESDPALLSAPQRATRPSCLQCWGAGWVSEWALGVPGAPHTVRRGERRGQGRAAQSVTADTMVGPPRGVPGTGSLYSSRKCSRCGGVVPASVSYCCVTATSELRGCKLHTLACASAICVGFGGRHEVQEAPVLTGLGGGGCLPLPARGSPPGPQQGPRGWNQKLPAFLTSHGPFRRIL